MNAQHSHDKHTLRKLAHQARANQTDNDRLSGLAVSRLTELPEYREAKHVMWYLHVRDELRTQAEVFRLIEKSDSHPDPQSITIPFCVGDQLQLFRLRQTSDLQSGRFGILEPRVDLRQDRNRQVRPSEIDVIIVPGVAFDESGGRIGHGKGYYDRLLPTAPQAVKIALAFESQIFPEVPIDEFDVPMNWIVTPERIIRCDESQNLQPKTNVH